jgi:hypothetical protein
MYEKKFRKFQDHFEQSEMDIHAYCVKAREVIDKLNGKTPSKEDLQRFPWASMRWSRAELARLDDFVESLEIQQDPGVVHDSRHLEAFFCVRTNEKAGWWYYDEPRQYFSLAQTALIFLSFCLQHMDELEHPIPPELAKVQRVRVAPDSVFPLAGRLSVRHFAMRMFEIIEASPPEPLPDATFISLPSSIQWDFRMVDVQREIEVSEPTDDAMLAFQRAARARSLLSPAEVRERFLINLASVRAALVVAGISKARAGFANWTDRPLNELISFDDDYDVDVDGVWVVTLATHAPGGALQPLREAIVELTFDAMHWSGSPENFEEEFSITLVVTDDIFQITDCRSDNLSVWVHKQ